MNRQLEPDLHTMVSLRRPVYLALAPWIRLPFLLTQTQLDSLPAE